ncbi:lipase family protein [Nocardia yamanashiensis]|uniref:lipase family protein n=1 Tax=Nocardia yamanashiensis TaxID=209247 RepID=UPI000836D783|nr:lipase family protein [Nocardia yamanashiensis]
MRWQELRPWWRTALTVLAVAVAAVVVVPTRADIPYPDDDPFYAAPADLADRPNGAILNSRPISVFGLALPVFGWQVQYRSTDSAGEPIADMATVMTPMTPWLGAGERPLLAYQVAEDSLGTQCAPSYALRGGLDFSIVNTVLDIPFLTAILLRGWSVVVPDYEGPQSRFFDGVTSGRGVLDGIRAARDFPPLGVTATTPLGAWGYSGGAFATLWAMQMRAAYAPDLLFSGVVSGGVPADIAAIARKSDGSWSTGLSILMLIALARNEPGSGLPDLLNDSGRELLSKESHSCGSELVVRYYSRHVDEFALEPNLLWHPVFEATTERQELGDVAPDVPLYLYHSNDDDVIPVAGYTALVNRYCALGANLTAVHSGIPGHNPAAAVEAFGAVGFLTDRFAGIPSSPGCTIR